MASALTLAGSLPVSVRASSGSAGKPDRSRRKAISSSSHSSAWWAPLFGWSADPDYINTKASDDDDRSDKQLGGAPESDLESGRPRSRFARGCFTEEKAKQLRRKTAEGKSFHDVMYHSAIAARLASDLSGRPGKGSELR